MTLTNSTNPNANVTFVLILKFCSADMIALLERAQAREFRRIDFESGAPA
jgi:hypothetical protein